MATRMVSMGKIVQPKNTLKEKAGSGGFREEDLQKAQEALNNNEVDFKPIAKKYLQLIKEALAQHKLENDSENLYAKLMDSLMQLRAQGSMFNYPSISILADVVVDLMDSLHKVDETIIEIVQAFEQSCSAILNANIKLAEDRVCVALVSELKIVCDKYKVKSLKH